MPPIDHPRGPIAADIPYSTHQVDHLGLTLRYNLWGDPSKPLVILQHGGKDHGRSWDWVVAQLAQDYCCAVPDLRGHGDSDWAQGGGYDMPDFVADFALIVADLKRQGFTSPFKIIGHSLGGVIALHYAAAFPADVATFVNVEGLGMTQEFYDRFLNEPLAERWATAMTRRVAATTRGPRIYHDLEAATQRLASVHQKLKPELIAHLAEHGVRVREGGVHWKHDPAISFITLRPQAPEVYVHLYKAITAPVLMVYGTESFMPQPQSGDERLGHFANAQLKIYDGAGHWLQHEHLDDFMQDVVAFWEEHDHGQKADETPKTRAR